jgi:hypothetical protein
MIRDDKEEDLNDNLEVKLASFVSAIKMIQPPELDFVLGLISPVRTG